jgi:hypothetical protein
MTRYTFKIEADEDDFTIVVGSDIDPGRYRFPVEDPEALYDHVRATIEPWLMERDAAKIEYDRMARSGDTRLLTDEQFTEYTADAYGDNFFKRVGMEQMREQGYA